MKNPFVKGDTKEYRHIVTREDIAEFKAGVVHPLYATFALTRDAEWAGRLFVLEMLDDDEEGIGTFVELNHRSPAMVGDEVVFTATLDDVSGNTIICSFVAQVSDREIASGRTGQKILKKSRIEELLNKYHG